MPLKHFFPGCLNEADVVERTGRPMSDSVSSSPGSCITRSGSSSTTRGRSFGGAGACWPLAAFSVHPLCSLSSTCALPSCCGGHRESTLIMVFSTAACSEVCTEPWMDATSCGMQCCMALVRAASSAAGRVSMERRMLLQHFSAAAFAAASTSCRAMPCMALTEASSVRCTAPSTIGSATASTSLTIALSSSDEQALPGGD
mmetsp:Transcript_12919/g.36604  ORF Transcript_12919/g.36604 Transcript_12919/m.36604 type:complete len:201 (-) Transcript_12919:310-912(-)